MAKYFGNIGYRTTVENERGQWKEIIEEKPYYGDILKNAIRNSFAKDMTTNVVSPSLNINVSLVADPYAFEHFHNIAYVTYMGVRWTVDFIDVQYPRIICTLGGLYSDGN